MSDPTNLEAAFDAILADLLDEPVTHLSADDRAAILSGDWHRHTRLLDRLGAAFEALPPDVQGWLHVCVMRACVIAALARREPTRRGSGGGTPHAA